MLSTAAMALLVALVLDLAFGEPPDRFHPVAWIGRTLAAFQRHAPTGDPRKELAFGAGMVLLTVTIFAGAAVLLTRLLSSTPPVAHALILGVLLKPTFALRALGEAGEGVRAPLLAGDLPEARRALRSLCSRDAGDFDESLVSAAAVESLAENSSDSVVAPLFWFLLLGLPGAVAYRVVNTADAMVGYRDAREYLGKFAARLDDALNFIPARLTALLLLLAGAMRGHGARRAVTTWWRDAGRTESPNAGHPMAAMAGSLGRRLEKPGHYLLGAEGLPPSSDDIQRAFAIVQSAAIGAALLAVCLCR